MIILVTGAIGSGKTHNTIRNELIPALMRGRKVYTNIDGLDRRKVGQYLAPKIKGFNFRVWDRLELVTDEWLLQKCQLHTIDGTGLEIEPHSTIIVDEAQMVWNSREFKKTGKAFIDLLAYSRHHDIDFVFMTQHAKLLEVVVTRLANQFQVCENLGFLGSLASKGYKVAYKRGLEDRPDYTSAFTYDLEIFPLYQSSKVPESMRSGRLPWQIWASAFSLLVLIFLISKNYGNSRVGQYLGLKKPDSSVTLSVPVSSSPVVAVEPVIDNVPISNAEKVLQALREYDNNSLRNVPITDSDSSIPYHSIVHTNKPPDPNGYVMRNTSFD